MTLGQIRLIEFDDDRRIKFGLIHRQGGLKLSLLQCFAVLFLLLPLQCLVLPFKWDPFQTISTDTDGDCYLEIKMPSKASEKYCPGRCPKAPNHVQADAIESSQHFHDACKTRAEAIPLICVPVGSAHPPTLTDEQPFDYVVRSL